MVIWGAAGGIDGGIDGKLCLQDTIVEPMICGWVVLYISILLVCRVPFCTKDARIKG